MTKLPLDQTGWRPNAFFSEAELRCKGSGMLRLHSGFLEELLRLRAYFAQPMFVASACRSTAHNRSVGGADDSLHLCDLPSRGCLAVDVRTTPDSAARLIREALRLGWSVGVSARGFTHVDARFLLNRPQVVFGY